MSKLICKKDLIFCPESSFMRATRGNRVKSSDQAYFWRATVKDNLSSDPEVAPGKLLGILSANSLSSRLKDLSTQQGILRLISELGENCPYHGQVHRPLYLETFFSCLDLLYRTKRYQLASGLEDFRTRQNLFGSCVQLQQMGLPYDKLKRNIRFLTGLREECPVFGPWVMSLIDQVPVETLSDVVFEVF